MAPTFTTAFVELIKGVLSEASKGIASSHHFHNVQAGIANILSLLEYDNAIGEAANRLTQTAANYLNQHDLASTTLSEQERRADADRLGLVQAALAVFNASLEHARPSSRVRALGLG